MSHQTELEIGERISYFEMKCKRCGKIVSPFTGYVGLKSGDPFFVSWIGSLQIITDLPRYNITTSKCQPR